MSSSTWGSRVRVDSSTATSRRSGTRRTYAGSRDVRRPRDRVSDRAHHRQVPQRDRTAWPWSEGLDRAPATGLVRDRTCGPVRRLSARERHRPFQVTVTGRVTATLPVGSGFELDPRLRIIPSVIELVTFGCARAVDARLIPTLNLYDRNPNERIRYRMVCQLACSTGVDRALDDHTKKRGQLP